MGPASQAALADIQACVHADRYLVLAHFLRRMDQRGMVWPDVLAVIDAPTRVRAAGLDRFNRPKWILTGWAADGLAVEVVCVLDMGADGNLIVFITIY